MRPSDRSGTSATSVDTTSVGFVVDSSADMAALVQVLWSKARGAVFALVETAVDMRVVLQGTKDQTVK